MPLRNSDRTALLALICAVQRIANILRMVWTDGKRRCSVRKEEGGKKI